MSDMYYNKEVKLWYLKERQGEFSNEDSIDNIKAVFKKTKFFEEKFKKDVADWAPEEIICFYKALGSSSLNSLLTRHSFLRGYADFCMANNLIKCHQNCFQEIDIETLKTCLNLTRSDDFIITREQLLEMISGFDNPSDKFLLLAPFEGIYSSNYKDIMCVKTGDFSGNTLTLNSGKVIEVSDELKQIAMESAAEFGYISLSEKRTQISFHKDEIDYVVKGLGRSCAGKLSASGMILRIERIRNYYPDVPKSITAKALNSSGRIDYINKIAAENNISGEDVVKDKALRSKVEERYPKIKSPYQFLINYGKYLV